MSALGARLGDLRERLSAAGVGYALVGGLAVSVRVEPRFTRDVDLAISVADDAAAEALVQRLVPPYELLASMEHDAMGRLAAVRIGASEAPTDPVADLLFASSGIEPEIVAGAEPLEILPGVVLPVATVGHLLALKLLSRDAARPQDDIDLVALLGVASREDRSVAADAVGRIVARGAHRDRPLEADWQRLVEEHG